jgi:hypothetical protein
MVGYKSYLCFRDVLFGRIYDRFAVDVIAKGTFLECLEPYIQSDRLTAIPPAVMKDFVDHYESRGMLDSVEACIVHLDIASLDIHQVGFSKLLISWMFLAVVTFVNTIYCFC